VTVKFEGKNKNKKVKTIKSILLQIAALDKRPTSIRVPDVISQKPRTLEDRAHWKATEFRAWLLHFSVPVLMEILPPPYQQHYSLMVTAMSLLVSEKISHKVLSDAEKIIDLFCKELGTLYGEKAMTMNAHQLRHFVYFVRLYGPLWVYSCFGFENMNGCLTSLIHGTRHNAEQVAFALSVLRNLPSLVTKLNPSLNSSSVMKFTKRLSCEHSSSALSFECQPGYFFLGKPKSEHLKPEHREALSTFFACQGMFLLANKVDLYYRLKMRR